MFKGKIVVITGGAKGIGKAIRERFCEEGATVRMIDIIPNDDYTGDICKKEVLEAFAEKIIEEHGQIDYLINNAPPLMKGIDSCSYEEFELSLSIGVTAPFYLSKLFIPYFKKGGSIINISSSRDRMSMKQTESYTAAKGGISALTHALAVSLSDRVRVNSISPGWINNTDQRFDISDEKQHPAGRIGTPLDIAELVLFLCSDKASFITGENICIDGGMTRMMIYNDEHGWSYSV